MIFDLDLPRPDAIAVVANLGGIKMPEPIIILALVIYYPNGNLRVNPVLEGF